jgi:hypothetical protein
MTTQHKVTNDDNRQEKTGQQLDLRRQKGRKEEEKEVDICT